MKIVVLDGYTENPGDLSWEALGALGDLVVYDRTSYEESDLIAERIGDAEIVVMNKTPISRATLDKCPNIKLIAVLATGYNVVDIACAREKGIPAEMADRLSGETEEDIRKDADTMAGLINTIKGPAPLFDGEKKVSEMDAALNQMVQALEGV